MKPGKLTLPTIWRGCTWYPVTIQWLDEDGNPINLTQWYPRAYTRHFTLNAQVTDAQAGLTTVGLNKVATSNLRQGVEDWDWVWIKRGIPGPTLPPHLKGKVTVRHPVTNPEALTVTRIGGGSNYVRIDECHNLFNVITRLDLFSDIIQSQLQTMRANGQNQITGIWWYNSGLIWPHPEAPPQNAPPNPPFPPPCGALQPYPNRGWEWAHTIIPYHPNGNPHQHYVNNDPLPWLNANGDNMLTDATLSSVRTAGRPSHQDNLATYLGWLNEFGFSELHVRFGAQGPAAHSTWNPVPANDNFSQATDLGAPAPGSTQALPDIRFIYSSHQADGTANPPRSEPTTSRPARAQWTVWYKIVADDQSWSFQVSNPNKFLLEAFHADASFTDPSGDKLVGGFLTVNVDVTNNKINLSPNPLSNDDVIRFVRGVPANTLPAPIVEGTYYYVINSVQPATGTGAHSGSFQVSASSGGAPIDLTSQGTGTSNNIWKSPSYYDLATPPVGVSNGSLQPPKELAFHAYPTQNGPLGGPPVHYYYIRVTTSLYGGAAESFPDAYTMNYGRNLPSILVPPYPTLPFPPAGWLEPQFQEESAFIRSVTALVEASKGDLKVTYDLGPENANLFMVFDPLHRHYCGRLYSEWTNQFGVVSTCGFSALPQGYGIGYMIDLLGHESGFLLPGSYAIDTYGHEYDGLKRVFARLTQEGAAETRKKIRILETFYNDAQVGADTRQAIRETGMNFGGIFQWPLIKGSDGKNPFFPDKFPSQFDKYINL